MRQREFSVFFRLSWKIWTLADIGAALTNQELALAVTSLRAEAENRNHNGGQSNCGCMWVPGAVYTSSYFYKNRNIFSNETGAACRSPSHDANSRLLCSEFHARMARISRANEASKLKMFKRPTSRDLFASGVNAPSVCCCYFWGERQATRYKLILVVFRWSLFCTQVSNLHLNVSVFMSVCTIDDLVILMFHKWIT